MNAHALLIVSMLIVMTSASHAAETPGAPTVEPISIFQKETRILFQGDSITDGNRGRNADPNHILGHGYVFIIAAKYGSSFAELNLNFMNRGVSGNKVTDLQNRWVKDTLELKPDVLSIMIGVNDNSPNGVPVDQYEQIYDKLLTDTKAALPNIRFVLCEPFLFSTNAQALEGIKKRQEIVARLAEKHHAALVKFQHVFDDACRRAPEKHWIWDGVHPTYSGHQLMADEWVKTVKEFWPVIK